jgi:serine/threonine-protein kinase
VTLQTGARFGPYEIVEPIGAGGMGEVYRARDTRLQRDVAIKVLPDPFATDAERIARFQREAQVIASISHPNIAGIHGIEEQGGVRALVLELVEGQTLAEIVAGTSRNNGAGTTLDLGEALSIAKQIAEALEAAHEQNIIHRDLKPANVKVTPEGTVKVLDFGLAKLVEPVGTGQAVASRELLTQSPTITSPAMMTAAGIILGTAAYMSPEQAKGRPADKRSDIWAFGCVFYELLAGKRAFDGEDLSDVLATVLKSEPDWNALPADLPPRLRTLVRQCLEKDRRQRLASMSVVLFVLGDSSHLLAAAPAIAHAAPSTFWRRVVLPIAAVVVTAGVVGPLAWFAARTDPPPRPVTRFAFSPTGRAALSVDNQSQDVAVAEDGSFIVYKGAGESLINNTELYVRAKDQLEPRALTGLGSPRAPFVSPDGRWIGFVNPLPVSLNKVSISGGPPIRLALLDGASRGVSWGADGSIVFATALPLTGLQRVSADGGEVTVLTKPDPARGEQDHLYPHLLPGGRAVLFTIVTTAGSPEASNVAVLDLGAGPGAVPKLLVRGASQAQYLPSGHLVYFVAGTLRAIAFDANRLEVSGSQVPVQTDVMSLPSGTAEFDVASDGTLVFVVGGVATVARRQLVWVDRQGKEEPLAGLPIRAYVYPRLSPDGTRVAVDIRDQDNDVWVSDLQRQTLTRLTFHPLLDESPMWTVDGRRVVYTSQQDTPAGSLFWQAVDGTGTPERLTNANSPQRASSVSPDGKSLMFAQGGLKTLTDVFSLSLDPPHQVEPILATAFVERNAVVSPDGRWVAYDSSDSVSGPFEVSVRRYPDLNSGRWQVSTAGGTRPLWSRDGRELFYLAPDGSPMVVSVSPGTAWLAMTPTRLFAWSTGSVAQQGNFGRTYDISRDGRRLLMVKDVEDGRAAATPTVVVVENWLEELKRLVPTRP